MSSPSFIVRPARAEDRPLLGRLGALLVAVHHDWDTERFIAPGPGTEAAYGGFLVSQLMGKDSVLLVAEEGGEGLGYVFGALEGNDWMALRGPAGVVYDLVVDLAHRRRGVGRSLLEAALAELAARGAPRVVLSTAEGNAAGQRLFAAAGFRRTMIEMTREADG